MTCLAHALHDFAEETQKQFPDVNSLISNVAKIFVKWHSRNNIFKENAPMAGLTPNRFLKVGHMVAGSIVLCIAFPNSEGYN